MSLKKIRNFNHWLLLFPPAKTPLLFTTIIMNSYILPSPKSCIISHPTTFPSFHSQTHHHLQPLKLTLTLIRTSSSNSNNTTSDAATAADVNPSIPQVEPPPSDKVQIKFRKGAKRKSRRKQENNFDSNGMPKKAEGQAVKKDWESMSLAEQAWELYIGEKGVLFWLNKFAYASIFIIIGAWILFRFVGPALNLYQLDAPPLSPTDVFKGA